MLVRFFASLVQLAVASLAIGILLAWFDISTARLLAHVGLTPEEAAQLVLRGFDWALPRMFLGAIFVVPFWLFLNLMRPPRGYE